MNPFLRAYLLCFPPACWRCGSLMRPLKGSEAVFPYLCPACREGLPWYNGDASGNPARPEAVADRPDGLEALDGVWAACRYEPPLDRWIWGFKYQGRDGMAHMLARLLAAAPFGASPLAGVDLVAPVPLHPRRLRERQYNQALLLAHGWLRSHGLRRVPKGTAPRLHPTLLERRRHTRPQMLMDATARRTNVAGAFALASHPKRGIPGSSAEDGGRTPALAGLRILLVDDVMTTGATLGACAAVLKAAGAQGVTALVLARA